MKQLFGKSSICTFNSRGSVKLPPESASFHSCFHRCKICLDLTVSLECKVWQCVPVFPAARERLKPEDVKLKLTLQKERRMQAIDFVTFMFCFYVPVEL